MCRVERWSVRALRQKINGMLFERTALSKKPEKLAKLELAKLRKEDQLSPDLVFKDPYFLDFLGLKGTYLEKDFEAAILRELDLSRVILSGRDSDKLREGSREILRYAQNDAHTVPKDCKRRRHYKEVYAKFEAISVGAGFKPAPTLLDEKMLPRNDSAIQD